MYDMHYDLLTALYFNFIEQNSKSNLEKLFRDLNKIYTSKNIKGGIISLCFMNQDEMSSILGIVPSKLKNVYDMFNCSLSLLDGMKAIDIINEDSDFIYEIEGADFINIKDIEKLQKLGLRVLSLSWNNKNKYASGNRSKQGLTNEGRDLLDIATNLDIAINLSNTNNKSFNDIINYLEYKKSIIIATHSNVRSICDNDKNLDDYQLLKLNEIGAYIGLNLDGNFIAKGFKNLSDEEKINMFLKHLDYLLNEVQYNKNKIMISSDDMNYMPDIIYQNNQLLKQSNMYTKLKEILLNHYDNDFVNDILINNPKTLIKTIKKEL